MNALKTKYSPNCKGSSVNSNSLMYYEAPGGSGEICPKLNCLVWSKQTKKPDGTSYNWGDADPTPYVSGFEWGHDCLPFIYLLSPGTYVTTQGDWIDSGATLSYVAGWEESYDNGVTWVPANPIYINTTNFTNDTYRPIITVTNIRSIVKVTSATCPTGIEANSLSYNLI